MRTSGKAIGSLVCGIIGLFACGLILGAVAIWLSSQAKEEIASSGGAVGGGGLAIAGMILGWIGVIGWAIGLILRFTVMA